MRKTFKFLGKVGTGLLVSAALVLGFAAPASADVGGGDGSGYNWGSGKTYWQFYYNTSTPAAGDTTDAWKAFLKAFSYDTVLTVNGSSLRGYGTVSSASGDAAANQRAAQLNQLVTSAGRNANMSISYNKNGVSNSVSNNDRTADGKPLLDYCAYEASAIWWTSIDSDIFGNANDQYPGTFSLQEYTNGRKIYDARSKTFITSVFVNGQVKKGKLPQYDWMFANPGQDVIDFYGANTINKIQTAASNYTKANNPPKVMFVCSDLPITSYEDHRVEVSQTRTIGSFFSISSDYAYSTTVERQPLKKEDGTEEAEVNANLESQEAKTTKTAFGKLYDSLIVNNDTDVTDLKNTINQAIEQDKNLDLNAVELSTKNQNGLRSGGVLNVTTMATPATITVETNRTFTDRIVYNYKENKNTGQKYLVNWEDKQETTDPTVSGNPPNRTQATCVAGLICESEFRNYGADRTGDGWQRTGITNNASKNIQTTPGMVAFYQLLGVVCNDEQFDAMVTSLKSMSHNVTELVTESGNPNYHLVKSDVYYTTSVVGGGPSAEDLARAESAVTAAQEAYNKAIADEATANAAVNTVTQRINETLTALNQAMGDFSTEVPPEYTEAVEYANVQLDEITREAQKLLKGYSQAYAGMGAGYYTPGGQVKYAVTSVGRDGARLSDKNNSTFLIIKDNGSTVERKATHDTSVKSYADSYGNIFFVNNEKPYVLYEGESTPTLLIPSWTRDASYVGQVREDLNYFNINGSSAFYNIKSIYYEYPYVYVLDKGADDNWNYLYKINIEDINESGGVYKIKSGDSNFSNPMNAIVVINSELYINNKSDPNNSRAGVLYGSIPSETTGEIKTATMGDSVNGGFDDILTFGDLIIGVYSSPSSANQTFAYLSTFTKRQIGWMQGPSGNLTISSLYKQFSIDSLGNLYVSPKGDNDGNGVDTSAAASPASATESSPAAGAWETSGAIRQRWEQLGGQDGPLGYPIGPVVCGLKDSGCYQVFQNGTIHFSPSTGAHATRGAIEAYWASQNWENGWLGYPTGEVVTVNGGASQTFQGGIIWWNASTGETYAAKGAILNRYAALLLEQGWLGFPTNDEICGLKDSGCFQDFQNGKIHWSPSTGAHATRGAILAYWTSQGNENGWLGYPTSEVFTVNGGVSQTFQGGTIFHNASTGETYATGADGTRGPIEAYWASQGRENGWLGYPTGEVVTVNGGASQTFQGGTVFHNASTGETYAVKKGAILTEYASLNLGQGWLGFPTGDEYGLKNGGTAQHFQNGKIHWSPSTGAHATRGAILAYWASQGWENGWLGYPTGEELTVNGGASQTFQGGIIWWNASTGEITVTPVNASYVYRLTGSNAAQPFIDALTEFLNAVRDGTSNSDLKPFINNINTAITTTYNNLGDTQGSLFYGDVVDFQVRLSQLLEAFYGVETQTAKAQPIMDAINQKITELQNQLNALYAEKASAEKAAAAAKEKTSAAYAALDRAKLNLENVKAGKVSYSGIPRPSILDFGDSRVGSYTDPHGVNVNHDARAAASGYTDFFNKICDVLCTPSASKLGSTSWGVAGEVGKNVSNTSDQIQVDSLGGVTLTDTFNSPVRTTNSNYLEIFRDNNLEARTLKVNLTYPDTTGTKYTYSGSLPKSTTVVLWDGSTPSSMMKTSTVDGGGQFFMTAVKNTGTKEALFDGTIGSAEYSLNEARATGDPKPFVTDQLTPYSTYFAERFNGYANTFQVGATWASEENRPVVLNVKWEYDLKTKGKSVKSVQMVKKTTGGSTAWSSKETLTSVDIEATVGAICYATVGSDSSNAVVTGPALAENTGDRGSADLDKSTTVDPSTTTQPYKDIHSIVLRFIRGTTE